MSEKSENRSIDFRAGGVIVGNFGLMLERAKTISDRLPEGWDIAAMSKDDMNVVSACYHGDKIFDLEFFGGATTGDPVVTVAWSVEEASDAQIDKVVARIATEVSREVKNIAEEKAAEKARFDAIFDAFDNDQAPERVEDEMSQDGFEIR